MTSTNMPLEYCDEHQATLGADNRRRFLLSPSPAYLVLMYARHRFCGIEYFADRPAVCNDITKAKLQVRLVYITAADGPRTSRQGLRQGLTRFLHASSFCLYCHARPVEILVTSWEFSSAVRRSKRCTLPVVCIHRLHRRKGVAQQQHALHRQVLQAYRACLLPCTRGWANRSHCSGLTCRHRSESNRWHV